MNIHLFINLLCFILMEWSSTNRDAILIYKPKTFYLPDFPDFSDFRTK